MTMIDGCATDLDSTREVEETHHREKKKKKNCLPCNQRRSLRFTKLSKGRNACLMCVLEPKQMPE